MLDVGLPGDIDGLEVCRQLRAASAGPGAHADRPATARSTASSASSWAPTTTSPSRSRPASSSPGSRPSCGAPTAPHRQRRTYSASATSRSTPAGARRAVDGDVVALATREFDLLHYLAENAGLALSRQQLLDGVWGPDWYGDERTVDVHVRQLRKKLGDALPLTTVWGVGYRLG